MCDNKYIHTPLRLRRNQRRKARSPGFFSDLQTRGDERRNGRGKRRDTKTKTKKIILTYGAYYAFYLALDKSFGCPPFVHDFLGPQTAIRKSFPSSYSKTQLEFILFLWFCCFGFFFLAPHLRIDNGILSRKMHNAETKDFNTF